jgi:hypothetical protein
MKFTKLELRSERGKELRLFISDQPDFEIFLVTSATSPLPQMLSSP